MISIQEFEIVRVCKMAAVLFRPWVCYQTDNENVPINTQYIIMRPVENNIDSWNFVPDIM